jgi:hypothetical protein
MKPGKLISSVFISCFLISLPSMVRGAEWSIPGDFGTIQEAMDSSTVRDGDSIKVSQGRHGGAVVTKRVTIYGEGGAVINDGPKPWSNRPFKAGFLFRGPKTENGSGTEIHHLEFENLDFPIFASQWGAVVSDVKIHDCIIYNPIQGITMWHTDDWDVRRNQIYDLRTHRGGGIGILVGSYSGDHALENTITQNEIFGTVAVHPEETGGYHAAGIYLCSDHRRKNVGGAVEGNRVTKNEIDLTSDNPDVISVVAIELHDSRDDPTQFSVTENEIKHNLMEEVDFLEPLVFIAPKVEKSFGNEIVGNKYDK